MAKNMLGLDPDQMDALGQLFKKEAAEIEKAASTIDGKLNSTPWEGPDKTKFVNDWQGHRKALQNCAQTLQGKAGEIKNQVAQQRQASGS